MRQRPGWLLAKICPVASTASQSWLDELLKSSEPREMIIDLLVATDRQLLRELLPPLTMLQGKAPIFELPARTRNCLQRNGIADWDQVLDLEPAHIRGFKNAGDLTVRSVVGWCVTHAERVVRDRPFDHRVGGGGNIAFPSDDPEGPNGSLAALTENGRCQSSTVSSAPPLRPVISRSTRSSLR